jgi:hypothetical protein
VSATDIPKPKKVAGWDILLEEFATRELEALADRHVRDVMHAFEAARSDALTRLLVAGVSIDRMTWKRDASSLDCDLCVDAKAVCTVGVRYLVDKMAAEVAVEWSADFKRLGGW